jgi:hypothetical protein
MKTPPRSQDWHLRAWMTHLGKRQADIIRDLGWERGRTSKVYNSIQPYGRADVVQLANWLGIEPYELLMAPHEALGLRNLRNVAHAIVAETNQATFESPATERRRTG